MLYTIIYKRKETFSVVPIYKDNYRNTSPTLHYYYEPKPNLVISTDTLWAKAKTYYNADSINAQINYTIEKPSHTFRIITVGDSYTNGSHVNTKDNYPSQLQSLLKNRLSCNPKLHFEVINLGVEGYDIQYTIERYNLHGKKYNPDLLLWLVVTDDFLRVNEIMLPKLNARYFATKNPVQRWKQEPRYITTAIWIPAREDTILQVGGIEKVYKNQYDLLQQFFSISHVPTVFFTFDTQDEKGKKLLRSIDQTHNQVTYQTIHDFRNKETTLLDGHPNKSGYTIMANEMLSTLVKTHTLPCKIK